MLILVLICLALLAYAYVGYPVLIHLLARLAPHEARCDSSYRPLVSACLPAYNVAGHLDAKLQSLVEQDYPAHKLEVLVYSDASDDGTDDVVRRWAERIPRIRLIRGERRAGKPTALNTLTPLARGELLLLTDARQPLDRHAVSALVLAMSDPAVGCATGNLQLVGPAGSGAYWRYENWIRTQESGFRSVVGMTGPIAMVRRAELGPLPDDLILDDVWVPMKLRMQGKRVVLVEAAKAYDAAFDDQREFSRKARTLAGNYQIFARLPDLLLPWRNPSWFETVSHKIMRLLCPWALLLLLVASARLCLGNPVGTFEWQLGAALLLAQGLLYAAALFGAALGRMGALARTFVVLNVAAQVGLWRFLKGRQAVTW
jgi:cellulose synthase/poly-beta-1,6-N-acetylglucosamine synthase-like glycosyltransferase